MPRYFFHLFDGEVYLDQVGAELRDDLAARRAALQSLSQTVGDYSDRFWAGEAWTMRVLEQSGRQVCLLKLAVELLPETAA